MNAPTMTAGMEIAYRLRLVPMWGRAQWVTMGWSEPIDICQSGAA